jgi:hypothetical protein
MRLDKPGLDKYVTLFCHFIQMNAVKSFMASAFGAKKESLLSWSDANHVLFLEIYLCQKFSQIFKTLTFFMEKPML